MRNTPIHHHVTPSHCTTTLHRPITQLHHTIIMHLASASNLRWSKIRRVQTGQASQVDVKQVQTSQADVKLVQTSQADLKHVFFYLQEHQSIIGQTGEFFGWNFEIMVSGMDGENWYLFYPQEDCVFFQMITQCALQYAIAIHKQLLEKLKQSDKLVIDDKVSVSMVDCLFVCVYYMLVCVHREHVYVCMSV